ncbi:enoyl-CoA hydratase/isomerase family protein [Sphingobium sp. HBC34]|uniref:Enoyl-CoA hydratase/isomerase family protein n=1 Tax=Sphingobium cyanobacteriorum TaxID=3063954 RepID=A0ABT8ZJ82_9SPHN|nr:enoyl-CoA hydratase/isomerase family protein [Sphingobium sp. HBC34]MDO7834408.1 enoyl-CoA hydratase/isomerase family protein [Sphingobium sp. HBC34]
MADDLLIEDRGAVRILTLNRPDDRNPASTALLFKLTQVARALAQDESVSAVVITGAGRAFSAGGDFQHFVATATDPKVARETIDNGRDFIDAMLDIPVPVIAAVNGAAVGFGATLLALSDIVIMAENAFIIEPHVNVGLVIGDGISVTWPFLTSLHKAKELAFTGDRLSAADAVACGLANKVVPAGAQLDEALAMAERIARQPRSALKGSKHLFNIYSKAMMDTVLKAQMDLQFAQTQGPEHGRIVQDMIDAQKRNQT